MCEVTIRNFNEKYDDIVRDIAASDFISIDCEFSGLSRSGMRLYDTPSARYEQLRQVCQNFAVFQIGVSAHRHTPDDNYKASVYTFYVFPRPYTDATRVFSSQVSSIFFLSKQNFDFNKVFHDGITFMRQSEVSAFEKKLCQWRFSRTVRSHINDAERKELESSCKVVSQWRETAKVGDQFEIRLSTTDPFAAWIVRKQIETVFRNVRARSTSSPSIFTITKLSTSNQAYRKEMQSEVRDLALGFTRLIKDITSLRKPLVGHNMFNDLLMIYDMFVAPLPTNYEAFKRSISSIFPEVYDTKVLASHVQSVIGRSFIGKWTSLEGLCKTFDEGKLQIPDMPVFESSTSKNYHDSGFDSYCTGLVFIKMAHMLSLWDPNVRTFKTVSRGHHPSIYWDTVKHLRNRVNVIRGAVPYIALDGPDPPPTTRPDPILLQPCEGEEDIDIPRVCADIAKFKDADVKPVTSRKAMILCSNQVTSEQIFKHFSQTKRYRLSMYKPEMGGHVRHRGRGAMGIALLGVTGLISLVLYRHRLKSRGT